MTFQQPTLSDLPRLLANARMEYLELQASSEFNKMNCARIEREIDAEIANNAEFKNDAQRKSAKFLASSNNQEFKFSESQQRVFDEAAKEKLIEIQFLQDWLAVYKILEATTV